MKSDSYKKDSDQKSLLSSENQREGGFDFFTAEKQPFSKWQFAILFVSRSVATRAVILIFGVRVR